MKEYCYVQGHGGPGSTTFHSHVVETHGGEEPKGGVINSLFILASALFSIFSNCAARIISE